MAQLAPDHPPALNPNKFRDPVTTAKGERRAQVALRALETLWINTGTLCNLTCKNCYIESSPTNDRLVYLTAAEVREYLDEIERDGLPTHTVGFTGGEPFMNVELPQMLDDVMVRGLQALVLTNAMKPMAKMAGELLAIGKKYPTQLTIRVSIDHYSQALHELERGARSWQPTTPSGDFGLLRRSQARAGSIDLSYQGSWIGNSDGMVIGWSRIRITFAG